MGWFDWLRKVPAPIIEHRRLGRVRASFRPAEGEWLWEVLAAVPTECGPLDMTFDAGEDGPGEAHERQLDAILANRDALTLAAVPLIAPELSDFLHKPFPENPWDELALDAVHLSGHEGEFEMNYSCKSWPDAMITVYFEGGRPTLVQLDD